jgi:hypothetical protein
VRVPTPHANMQHALAPAHHTGPKSAATPQGFLFLGKQSPYSFHMPVPSQPNFPGAVVAPTGLLELGHIVPQLTTGGALM